MSVFAAAHLFDLQHVQGWLEWGGYFLLFLLLLFACGLGLPLPEDIPLLLAGFFVAQEEGTPGKMHLLPAAVLAWCGIIGGDCMLYMLGRKYGLNVTRLPLIGHHVTEARILRAEKLFEQWGILVVGVGRMFAGIRGAMVIAAGAIRYQFVRFVIADGLAAIVSGGLFILLGYGAGRKLGSLSELSEKIKRVEGRVLLALAVIVISFIVFALLRKKKHSPTDVVLQKAADHVDRVQHLHHPAPPPSPPNVAEPL